MEKYTKIANRSGIKIRVWDKSFMVDGIGGSFYLKADIPPELIDQIAKLIDYSFMLGRLAKTREIDSVLSIELEERKFRD